MPVTKPLMERISAGSSIDPETGCWVWQKALNHKGYGVLQVRNKLRSAHRTSYQVHVGTIPAGMQIDHLCRNRACVNPDHLEPVEPRENTMRSPIAPAAVNARKDACNYGHELTDENVRIEKSGSRRCKRCAIQRNLEYRRRRRLIIQGGPKAGRPTIEIVLEAS